MATNLPIPPSESTLFAAIDMGSNSFKMLIVRSDSTGKFFTVNRIKEPVVLGRDAATISFRSQARALEALHKFNKVLHSYHIPTDRTRCVATAAVREATNTAPFTDFIRERTGLDVQVLSGEEEARLCYLGVLQFLPIYEKLVLNVDIGGRSTEFVIGKKGEVVFGISLKLGHVNLTQRFVSGGLILQMREHIRSVIQDSGLVDKVREFGFEVAVGSSGTVRTVEKAVFHGYAQDMDNGVDELLGGQKRDWKFSRAELRSVVEKLCSEGEEGRPWRDGLFNRRSEFIVAGAVLLEEIFEMLGIEEMETSGYSLGEGVIADTLAKVYDGYDLYVNARWRSIVRLAARFNNIKRTRAAAQCAVIAKEIFEGFRKCNELAGNQNSAGVSLDDRDLEYLEAACMLHNIGVYTGKNGYHKESFRIIMNGDHLHGYDDDEVKLIALLTKHHRKKFPKFGHSSLKEFPEEVKQKFGILCAIIRISFILRQYESMELQGMELEQFHEGFKLVLRELPHVHDNEELIAEDVEAALRKELERFKMVSRQDFQVVFPSRVQDHHRDAQLQRRCL